MESKGLYIHIPFCKYICSYCDFGKKYIKNQPVDDYIASLVREMSLYQPVDITTIYIGGGTPSSLSLNQLELILKTLVCSLDFTKVEEFTVELNPDDVNDQLLQLLKKYNVSRLSIGAQTLNNDILQLVRRNHTGEEVIAAYTQAMKYFENINIDFMFNLPTQKPRDIRKVIEFIEVYVPTHISFYGLIFEDNTILSTESYNYWSEDQEGEIYQQLQASLTGLGYINYEISNFCQPSFASKHNLKYWNNENYYGIGLGASGYLDKHRYTNTRSLSEYIAEVNRGAFPIAETEELTTADILYEKIMLGLRTNEFTSLPVDLIADIKATSSFLHYLDFKENSIRIKPEYFYVSNQIIVDILERI